TRAWCPIPASPCVASSPFKLSDFGSISRKVGRALPWRKAAVKAPPMSASPPRPLTISARGPLKGQLTVPGDKSISHRALMFSALSVGESVIEGLLEGEDVLATAAAMRAMGADVQRDDDGIWRV